MGWDEIQMNNQKKGEKSKKRERERKRREKKGQERGEGDEMFVQFINQSLLEK